jgi:hypothetical protein
VPWHDPSETAGRRSRGARAGLFGVYRKRSGSTAAQRPQVGTATAPTEQRSQEASAGRVGTCDTADAEYAKGEQQRDPTGQRTSRVQRRLQHPGQRAPERSAGPGLTTRASTEHGRIRQLQAGVARTPSRSLVDAPGSSPDTTAIHSLPIRIINGAAGCHPGGRGVLPVRRSGPRASAPRRASVCRGSWTLRQAGRRTGWASQHGASASSRSAAALIARSTWPRHSYRGVLVLPPSWCTSCPAASSFSSARAPGRRTEGLLWWRSEEPCRPPSENLL